jgi:hypothetical protein
VKSRAFAEKNIMIRVTLEAQLSNRYAEAQTAEEAADYILVSVNSGTRPDEVTFGKRNRRNTESAFDRCLDVEAQLARMLGKDVVNLYAGQRSSYICTDLSRIKVRIGLWHYATHSRETRNRYLRSTVSWFRVRRRALPEYVAWHAKLALEIAANPRSPHHGHWNEQLDGFVVGQFTHFYELLTAWRDDPWYVGAANLYALSEPLPVTGLCTIDTSKQLKLADFSIPRYVDLRQIDTQVALAPVYTEWKLVKDMKDHERMPELRRTSLFTVMPLSK